MKTEITINFDGSCAKNPNGAMGFGCMIESNNGILKHLHGGEEAKVGNTNNIAEYKAILLGLDYIIENNIQDANISVYGDSNLVIQQLNGDWNIKIKPNSPKKGPLYAPYAFEAREKVIKIIKELGNKISFTWIPREENTKADELSNIFHGGSAGTSNFDYKSFMKKNQF